MRDVLRLRVLTFNIWLTPVAAADLIERLDKFLAQVDDYDVISLQEVFLHDQYLRKELASRGFPYFVLFTSGTGLPLGASGSGCAIASRYPIVTSSFRPFSCAGLYQRIDHSDAQAGKGIGLARILIPGRGTVDVFVSHFVAQYSDSNDLYKEQRILSAVEAVMFILASSSSPLSLLCVDLNAHPDKLVYRAITSLTGMTDTFSAIKGNDLYEPTFGVKGNVYTSHIEKNSEQSYIMNAILLIRSLLSSSSSTTPLQCDDNARLDYILYRCTDSTWQISNSEIRLDETFLLKSGKKASYSDHCAVSAEFSNKVISESSQRKKRRKSETALILSNSSPISSSSSSSLSLELVEIRTALEEGLETVTNKAKLQRLMSVLFASLSMITFLYLSFTGGGAVKGVTAGAILLLSIVFVLTGLMISETALGLAIAFFLICIPISSWLLFLSLQDGGFLGFISIVSFFLSILFALIATVSSEGHRRSFMRGLEEVRVLEYRENIKRTLHYN